LVVSTAHWDAGSGAGAIKTGIAGLHSAFDKVNAKGVKQEEREEQARRCDSLAPLVVTAISKFAADTLEAFVLMVLELFLVLDYLAVQLVGHAIDRRIEIFRKVIDVNQVSL
jgi:diacylglycerol kinase